MCDQKLVTVEDNALGEANVVSHIGTQYRWISKVLKFKLKSLIGVQTCRILDD